MLELLKKTTSESKSIATSLSDRLRMLQSEIATDEDGIVDLSGHLARLEKDRKKMQQELRRTEGFLESLADESKLGGLTTEFEKMERFVKEEYGKAKKAMKMLETRKT